MDEISEPEESGTRRPVHFSGAAAALGVFGSTVVFDYLSWTSDDQFIFARGGQTLIGIGLVVGVLAVLFYVGDIAQIPSGTPERRRAGLHLMVFDLLLVWFGIRFLMQQDKSLVPVTVVVGAFSAFGVAAGVVSHLLSLPTRRAAANA